MKVRQHRCPYYLLKISKDEFDKFMLHKSQEDNQIKYYQSQLNILSEKIKVYESAIQNIFNIVKPIPKFKEPIPLTECVERAYLSPITKSNTLILVNKYIQYCNNIMNSKITSNKGEVSLEEMPSIYEPDMAYEFITKKNPPYKSTTVKKHLNSLFRLLKISTNNPFLRYTLPIGNCEATKLKHLLTINEIKNFIIYLNQTRHYFVIVMLLYKFVVRIGAISKLRCLDLDNNNQIIFKEKNNIIIRRLLLNEASSVIHRLIDECNLKKEDFLFYDFKFKEEVYKRLYIYQKKSEI
jgi:integrase